MDFFIQVEFIIDSLNGGHFILIKWSALKASLVYGLEQLELSLQDTINLTLIVLLKILPIAFVDMLYSGRFTIPSDICTKLRFQPTNVTKFVVTRFKDCEIVLYYGTTLAGGIVISDLFEGRRIVIF